MSRGRAEGVCLRKALLHTYGGMGQFLSCCSNFGVPFSRYPSAYTTLPWVPASPEACLSFEASPFQFNYNTLHPILLTESWNCPKKSKKFTFQRENNCSFNIACHSSLLSECSGNAFLDHPKTFPCQKNRNKRQPSKSVDLMTACFF